MKLNMPKEKDIFGKNPDWDQNVCQQLSAFLV